MKKLYLILISICLSVMSFSQVAINTTGIAPDGSAMLDIVSINKGILIPRMANHTSIGSPAQGVMVFNTSTQTFWFYTGSVWAQIAAGGGSGTLDDAYDWGGAGFGRFISADNGAVQLSNGTDIINLCNNTSSVLDISSTNKGLLIPRLAITGTTTPISGTKTEGLLVYNTSTSGTYSVKGFYYWDGSDWAELGGSSGSSCTTLWDAYNCGGAGVGRNMQANSGSVHIGLTSGWTTDNTALSISVISTAASNAKGIDVSQTGYGYGIYAESSQGRYPLIYAKMHSSSSSYKVSAVEGENNYYGSAIYGHVNSGYSDSYGIKGVNLSAFSSGTYGIYAEGYGGLYAQAKNNSGYAIYANSNSSSDWNRGIYVKGKLDVSGWISKGGGSFKIDHPLDPENKFLYHSFVESPDMMNIYNGNVILDTNGEAIVKLSDYFNTLNIDYRYQMTAINAAMPNLHISQKIKNNKFKISGGAANGEVSWQVTGIRNDKFAQKYRMLVEPEKDASEKGKYLYPDLYELPQSKGINPYQK